MELMIRFFLSVLTIAAMFVTVAAIAKANPPQPDPHPSACKQERKAGKPCRASKDRRAYTYRIIWRVEDQDGNVSYAPGVCRVPVRGPVTCSITVSWG